MYRRKNFLDTILSQRSLTSARSARVIYLGSYFGVLDKIKRKKSNRIASRKDTGNEEKEPKRTEKRRERKKVLWLDAGETAAATADHISRWAS